MMPDNYPELVKDAITAIQNTILPNATAEDNNNNLLVIKHFVQDLENSIVDQLICSSPFQLGDKVQLQMLPFDFGTEGFAPEAYYIREITKAPCSRSGEVRIRYKFNKSRLDGSEAQIKHSTVLPAEHIRHYKENTT